MTMTIMMMKSMMITTAALVLALSTAVPCEATTTTHRRTTRTGTELYRVQPTQKAMPLAASSHMKNHADFEKFDKDAKRALRELMTFPAIRHLSWEVTSSMEYLSLSFAPVMSMMSPPPTIAMSSSPTPVPIVLSSDDSGRGSDIGDDNSNVAPINRATGVGAVETGTNDDEFNKPAMISAAVFLLIAAMAVTALVIRKYKRVVMMAGGAGGLDEQSIFTGSVFTNDIERTEQNIPITV